MAGAADMGDEEMCRETVCRREAAVRAGSDIRMNGRKSDGMPLLVTILCSRSEQDDGMMWWVYHQITRRLDNFGSCRQAILGRRLSRSPSALTAGGG